MNRSRSKRKTLLQAEVERIVEDNETNVGAFRKVGSAIGTVAHGIDETAKTVVKSAQLVNLGLTRLQDEIIEDVLKGSK